MVSWQCKGSELISVLIEQWCSHALLHDQGRNDLEVREW